MVGNIIPFIGGEEEKSEQEPLRVLGKVENGQIVKAELPKITCQCIRVPVLNGHTAAVFINFEKKPTKEQLIEKLVNFKGFPQEANLPSAPKQFIQYLEEDNRPQVTQDVNYENGMGVSIGRLREDSMFDYKFVGLSHNTVRGAAGGAVLCAEALTAKGYIQAKKQIKENIGHKGGCHDGNDNDTEDPGSTCRVGLCRGRTADHGKIRCSDGK